MKYRAKVLLTIAFLLGLVCFFNYLLQYEAVLSAGKKQVSIKPQEFNEGPLGAIEHQGLSRQVCDLGLRMDSSIPIGCPGDKAYGACVRVFNSALTGLAPLMVVRPRHETDIRIALVRAAEAGLQITVKNGGHNPAGLSLNHKGIVIDMADMNSVKWGGDSRLDIVSEGGAKWADVHKVLKDKTRTIVGGGCPQVGVVGLALGGGVGWISRSRGLVSDNLLSVRIVFPNGTLAVVDDERNPELMWALRGAGGSNFGVVTEVRLRTFPAEDMYFAGVFCYEKRPDDIRNTLELVQSVMNGDFDDRLTMDLFMSRSPQRSKELDHSLSKVRFCWGAMFDGPIADAVTASQELLDQIAELPSEEEACRQVPSRCQSVATTKDAVDRLRSFIRNGGPWLQKHSFRTWSSAFGADHMDVFWKSVMAESFTEEMVQETIRHFSDVPEILDDYGSSPVLQIAFEHLGGAMSRNKDALTAWKHGKARVMGSLQSYIPHPYSFAKRGSKEHTYVLQYLQNWTRSYYDGLAPHSQGSYGNYADSELTDWADKYYGREVYDRLWSLKKTIQGSEIFSAEQRIDLKRNFEAQHSVDSLSESGDNELGELETSNSRTNPVAVIKPTSKVCPREILETMVPFARSEGWRSSTLWSSASSKLESPIHSISTEAVNTANHPSSLIRVNETVLVTGGSRGIGWSATLHMANLGMSVVFTSQRENGCEESLGEMNTIVKTLEIPGSISCTALALDDFESIRTFTERTGQILFDVVVLNAGNFEDFRISEKAGNVSNSLAVNHLGHFLLVHELLKGKYINPTSGAIIVASSFALESATKEWIENVLQVPAIPYSDLDASSSVFESGRFSSYAAVKAVNYMFAHELTKRLEKSGSSISVEAVAPYGTAETGLSLDIVRKPERFKEVLKGGKTISTAEAALGIVYSASGLASKSAAQQQARILSGCSDVNINLQAGSSARSLYCTVWDSSLKLAGLTRNTGNNLQVVAFTSPCKQDEITQ